MGEEKTPEYKANPSALDGVGDMSQLTYLEEENVLYNLECRYNTKNHGGKPDIYTNISGILIAVNPYEKVEHLYGLGIMAEYRHTYGGRKDEPHIYKTSAEAQRQLRMESKGRGNQSILVCGESGSGKTESAKLCLKFLTTHTIGNSPTSGRAISITDQIMAVNPILESFGNAQTVMNNNSSRFAKFTKILYHRYDDMKHTEELPIIGSMIETYLLEKPRVVFQDPGELNFHVFYQLYHLPQDQLSRLALIPNYKFKYLKRGYSKPKHSEERAVMQGEKWCKELRNSFDLMKFDKDIQMLIFDIVAGVLHLGNISFKPSDEGSGDGVKIKKSSKENLEVAAKLFGITTEALRLRLTTETSSFGRESITKVLPLAKAEIGRDAISKSIYASLFQWIVLHLNRELYKSSQSEDDEDSDESDSEDEEKEGGEEFIGILDVFGFECFANNSFEQYCINYANEQLQSFFDVSTIQSEQNEYIREGVEWREIEIADNSLCIFLMKIGFKELDSACLMPKGTAEMFVTNMRDHKQVRGNEHYLPAKRKRGGKKGGSAKKGLSVSPPFGGAPRPRSRSVDISAGMGMLGRKSGGGRASPAPGESPAFGIKHFARDVEYNSKDFLDKNNDKTHPDTNKTFRESSSEIVRILFPEIDESKSKRSFRSIGKTFMNQMDGLMQTLQTTEPHFVRCINPNNKKKKRRFDRIYVGKQLRSGGVIGALRVIKLGYPTRVPYNVLYEMYHGPVGDKVVFVRNMQPKDFCQAILIAFGVEEDFYQLGVSKVFFRPAKAAVMGQITETGGVLPPECLERLKRWYIKKRMRRMKGSIRAYVRMDHLLREVRAWQNWYRIATPINGIARTMIRHMRITRRKLMEKKFKDCSLVIQARVRSMLAQQRVQEATFGEKQRIEKEIAHRREMEKAKRERDAIRAQKQALATKKAKEEAERIAQEEQAAQEKREREEREAREKREREEREAQEKREREEREAQERREHEERKRIEREERLRREQEERDEKRRREQEVRDEKRRQETLEQQQRMVEIALLKAKGEQDGEYKIKCEELEKQSKEKDEEYRRKLDTMERQLREVQAKLDEKEISNGETVEALNQKLLGFEEKWTQRDEEDKIKLQEDAERHQEDAAKLQEDAAKQEEMLKKVEERLRLQDEKEQELPLSQQIERAVSKALTTYREDEQKKSETLGSIEALLLELKDEDGLKSSNSLSERDQKLLDHMEENKEAMGMLAQYMDGELRKIREALGVEDPAGEMEPGMEANPVNNGDSAEEQKKKEHPAFLKTSQGTQKQIDEMNHKMDLLINASRTVFPRIAQALHDLGYDPIEGETEQKEAKLCRMTLDGDFDIDDDNQLKVFCTDFCRDVTASVDIEQNRVVIIAVQAGSLNVYFEILEVSSANQTDLKSIDEVAAEIGAQCFQEKSNLKRGKVTRHATGLIVDAAIPPDAKILAESVASRQDAGAQKRRRKKNYSDDEANHISIGDEFEAGSVEDIIMRNRRAHAINSRAVDPERTSCVARQDSCVIS